MKSSEDLYHLIHNLSPNEKRYFRISISGRKEGKASNGLRLFSALNKMEKYNEEILREKYAGESFLKYLSAEKNALYNSILKVMRQFASHSSVETKIHHQLESAHFLRNKGLVEQSSKLLQKAKRFALEQEAFHWLGEIALLERKIIKQGDKASISRNLNASWEESERFRQNLNEKWVLLQLMDQVLLLARKEYRIGEGDDLKKLEDLMQHSLLQEEASLQTAHGKIYFNQIWGYYTHITHQAQDSLYFFQRASVLFEESFGHLFSNENSYRAILANCLHSAFQAEQYELMPDLIKKMKNLKSRTWWEEAEAFQNIYFFDLLYCLNTFQLDAAKGLVPAIEAGLERYAPKVNLARLRSFYYNIFMLYFICEEFSMANTWLRKVLNLSGKDFRQDLHRTALAFSLLAHFEMGNEESLESILRSAERGNMPREGKSFFFPLFFRAFKRIWKARPGQDRRAAFQICLADLEKSSEATEIGIQEIKYWLESRARGCKIIDIIKEQSR